MLGLARTPLLARRLVARVVQLGIAAAWLTTGLGAQERKVPSDSEELTLAGCAKGRTFTVVDAPEREATEMVVAPGRRFRLQGPKDIMEGIKRREGRVIEVTGLVRKSQVAGPGGIPIAGGRIRIGAAQPRSPLGDPARDPAYNQAVLDISAWRVLDGDCPSR
jgi:hypothetical protein